jgi:NADH-quinone oxidoreductase subunit C
MRDVLQALRDLYGYRFLSDITAVDWDQAFPRFTGIYHLFHLETHEYVRIAVDCPSNSHPSLPSIADLWATADWHEREVYDMFGIHFENHPDLRRILMWEEYPWHPLRKDFPLAGFETKLPAEDMMEQDAAPVLPAPMMGGPFHSRAGGPMSQMEPRAADQSWAEKDQARFRKE